MPDEQLVDGIVSIVRLPDPELVKEVIAHELGHAFSYSHLSKAQRGWFVVELAKVDPFVNPSGGFNTTDYTHTPSEQWARGMAACVGYPDHGRRPSASWYSSTRAGHHRL